MLDTYSTSHRSDRSDRTDRIAIVVEDEPHTRQMIMRVLHGRSFSPIGFGSAEAALAWLEMHPPPALLHVDVHLPIMCGFRFIEKVRQDPRLKDVPIVVVTARTHPDDEATALELDCAYLPKPFRIKEYGEAIGRITPPERQAAVQRA